MTYSKIIMEKKNGIARITLNRPEVLNAIDEELLSELIAALDEVEKDDSINVVILSGMGRAFSAGRDMKAIQRSEGWVGGSRYKALEDLSKPVIAAVHGYCFTGAFELVMCADIIIASEDAIFSLSEVRIGVVPACISPYLIKKVGEGSLKELFITGLRFSPDKALKINLINYLVAHSELLEFANEKAEELLKCGPNAIAVCKKLFIDVPEMDLKTAYDHTADIIAKLRISDEAQEGMKAFLEKRMPKWRREENK